MKLPIALFLALTCGSLAVPVKRPTSSCSSQCSGVNNNFRYESGKAYVYELESETKVQSLGVSAPTENTIRQTATVTINVEKPCELALKLSDVSLTGASVTESWKSTLESRPLRFSFDDGVVQHICPAENDPVWVLNIKRGILSTFQNSLQGTSPQTQGHEHDISGHCPTSYEVKNEQGKKEIQRRKNLLSCHGFHGNYTAIRAVPYKVNSNLQQTPIVDSDQHCRHVIRRQILQDATCTETHVFEPFKGKQDGSIRSTTTQKLTFVREENADSQSFHPFTKQLPIQFDHSEYEFEKSQEAANNAQNDIHRLCELSSENVRKETPSVFTSLVYNLRKMQETELRQLFESSRANSKCSKQSKFMLDAIPMCGTGECVKLMVHLLETNELSGMEQLRWFMGFAFVQRPTSEMVRDILPLVETEQVKGLLGLSSMVHNYCKHNPLCAENPEVGKFMKKLQERLGQNCAATGKDNIETMTVILKSVGNVGHYSTILPTLQQCMKEETNPLEIRLAAVNALRRMPCQQETLDNVWQVFERQLNDPELRVMAFLQLARCPNQPSRPEDGGRPHFVARIEQLMKMETVNQVGSFVYSFVRSKKHSADPTQIELQQLLRQIRIDRRFNRDPRQFSRFTELSQFYDTLNMGGQMEKGMVFSSNSILPRNLFANLTVHLFGSSINLVEFGARQQGLDKLLDDMVGPEGYFSHPNRYEFQEERAGKKSNRLQVLEDIFVKREQYTPRERLMMSMYLKVFGNELVYLGFEGNNIMDDVKELMNLEKMLTTLAEQRQVKLTKNVLFADSVKTIPTISGLPLRVAINGTASINLDIGGKMDFTKLMKQPHDMDIKTEFKPSAAIEISTLFALQTGPVRSGVKMVTRLHTSTAVETSLQLQRGLLVKAKVSLPQDKMEIIDIESSLYNVINNQDQPANVQPSDSLEYKVCTHESFNRLVGLKLCAQTKIPRGPPSLFKGPYRALIALEKSDKKLMSYETELEWSRYGYPKRFLFNTPGSDVDREVRLQIDHRSRENQLNVELRTPVKEVNFQGEWTAPEPRKGEGKLILTIDGSSRYTLDLKTEWEQDQAGRIMKYEATGTAPNRQPITFKSEAKCLGEVAAGDYRMPRCQSFDLEAKMTGLYEAPIEFKTKYDNSPYQAEISWKCPASEAMFKALYESDASRTPGHTAHKRHGLIEGMYKRVKSGKTYEIKYESNIDSKYYATGVNFELKQTDKFETNFAPEWNVQTTMESKRVKNEWDMKYDVRYGVSKKQLLVELDGKVSNQGRHEIDYVLKCDHFDINENGQMIYENRIPEKLFASVKCIRGDTKQQRIYSEVRFENANPQGSKIDIVAEAKMVYPGREMRVLFDMNEPNSKEYKTQAIAQWQTNQQLEINSDIHYKYGTQSYEYLINSVAKMTGYNDQIYFHKRVKVHENEMKYVAYLKQGTRSLYDINLDMKREKPHQYRIQSHMRSHMVGDIDYQLTGDLKTDGAHSELKADVKRDEKEFGKIEITVPNKLEQVTSKKVKGQVMWDLDTAVPKELMGEYKFEDGQPTRHQVTVKSQLNGANYKYDVKVQIGDSVMVNSTFTKNNQMLLEKNVGVTYQPNRKYIEVDAGIKTQHPWNKRHYTGKVILHDEGYRQRKAELELKCHMSNKKVLLLAELGNDINTESKRKWTFKTQALEYGAEVEGYINQEPLKNSGGYSHKVQVQQMNKIFWAEGKEASVQFYGELNPERRYKYMTQMWIEAKTPYQPMTQGKFWVKVDRITQRHIMFETTIEKNTKETFAMEGAIEGPWMQKMNPIPGETPGREFNVKIKMNSESMLKKAQLELKGNAGMLTDPEIVEIEGFRVQNGQIDYKLTWNDVNEFSYSYDADVAPEKKCSLLGSFTLKIPAYEVDRRSRLDLQFDPKTRQMDLTQQMTSSNEVFKLGVNVDVKNKKSTVKLQTPYKELETAMLKITSLGNNEYKIETEHNGEKGVDIKGQYISDSENQKLKLEVDSVEKPFEFAIERTLRHRYKQAKVQLIRNPKTEQKQEYSIELMMTDMEKRDFLVHLVADHRYVKMEYQEPVNMKDGEVPFILVGPIVVQVNFKLEIQPNGKSNREPTMITAVTRSSEKEAKIKFQLTDPNLSQPMTLQTVYKRESSNQHKVTLTLDYTGQKTDKLTVTGRYKMEQVPQEGTKQRYSASIEHIPTKMHGKVWIEQSDYKLIAGVEGKNDFNEVKQCEVELTYPGNRFGLRVSTPFKVYRIDADSRRNEVRLIATGDNQPICYISAKMMPNQKKVMFEIRESEISDILFHASGQLINEDVALARIWHTEKGKRIDDGEIRVELNRADLLKTKLYLRPGMHRELQFAASKGLEKLRENAPTWEYNRPNSARTLRTPQLFSDLHSHTQQMRQNWAEEQSLLLNELDPYMDEMTEQLQDLTEMVQEFFWALVDITEQSFDEFLRSIPGDSFQEAYRKMKDSLSNFSEYWEEVTEPLNQILDQLADTLEMMKQKANEYRGAMKDLIKDNFDVDKMRESVEDAWEKLCDSDAVRQTQQWLQSIDMDPEVIRQKVNEIANSLLDKITQWTNKLQRTLDDWEQSASENPLYESLVKPMLAEVKTGDMKQKIKQLVEKLRTKLFETYSPQKFVPRVTVNNPEEGHYEMEWPLPMEAQSLPHLGQQLHPTNLRRIKENMQDRITDWTGHVIDMGEETGYGVMDHLYQYKPRSWDVVDWVPPFSQHAYLIGNQHIVTFDGKVFDFNADCEYLLASDFFQQKFTISASFEKRGSRTVLSKVTAKLVGGKVQLSRDGRTEIDDQQTELPWQKLDELEGSMLLQVSRKEHATVVRTFDGIVVTCDWYYHICQISLPGRYHGQSAGLLGSNDNEPHNDLFLPDGSENVDIDAFARKWHLSGSNCDAKRNTASMSKIEQNHEMHSVCEQYFKESDSPFRSCFLPINPRPFLDMCLTDMHGHVSRVSSSERHQEGLCNISAAYLMACKEKTGNVLDMPSHCVRCNDPREFTEVEGTIELRPTQMTAADIVYVVQESPCMSWVQEKIDSLTDQLVTPLNIGKSNVRFGLVGFSGEGVHDKPHFHTGKNQIVMKVDALKAAIPGLSFERISETIKRDPMEALTFAAEKFPFRAGTLKTVVLLTCGGCDEREVDYYDLQQTYLQRDIKLHLFTGKEISTDVPTEPIIGFDARQMYGTDGQPKPDLRSSLTRPHDSCTVLAQETSGTVWTISQASSSQLSIPAEKVSSKINAQLSTTNPCQVCECSIEWFSPKTVCYPCEVPRPVSLGANSYFFNLPHIKLSKTLEDWDKWIA